MKRLAFFAALALVLVVISGGSALSQDVKALVDQGMANCEKGRFDQAIDNFTQAIKLKPNDPSLYDLRGVAKYAKGMNSQAIEDHNQALKLDPKFAKAYKNRALVYFTLEDYQKSLDDLRQAQSLGFKVDADFLKMVERRAATKGK